MKFAKIVLLLSLPLAGCAAPSIYQWGGYDANLYASYKDPNKTEDLRLKLEAHIAAQEAQAQKVAPGLYAELGTLYLQMGSADKAIAMYSRERDTWPESRGLMTAMINNLERRKQASLEVKQ